MNFQQMIHIEKNCEWKFFSWFDVIKRIFFRKLNFARPLDIPNIDWTLKMSIFWWLLQTASHNIKLRFEEAYLDVKIHGIYLVTLCNSKSVCTLSHNVWTTKFFHPKLATQLALYPNWPQVLDYHPAKRNILDFSKEVLCSRGCKVMIQKS